jgi:hypothetical protein
VSATDRAEVERFVRADLGCKCPDDVFDSIAIERDATPGVTSPCIRLVVGNRLLIYVLEAASGSAAPDDVAGLATRGPAERDARGFNRFRLVVASERPAELRARADESFARIAGHDDRAHLHVIALDRLPKVLRRT